MRDQDDYYYNASNRLLNKLEVQVKKTFFYSVSMILGGYGIGYVSATAPGESLLVPCIAMAISTIFWIIGITIKEKKPPN